MSALTAPLRSLRSQGDGHLDFDDFVQMFERARGDATGFEPYKVCC